MSLNMFKLNFLNNGGESTILLQSVKEDHSRNQSSIMSMAVWKALLYKSFTIYRTKYFVTAAEVVWPCLLLLFVIQVRNLGMDADGDSKHPHGPDQYEYDLDSTNAPQLRSGFVHHRDINSAAGESSTALKMFLTAGPKRRQHKEPYFTEATFRKKILQENHRHEKIKIRKERSADGPDQGNGMPLEICAIPKSFVLVVCFIGAWSGAGALSHAERMSGTVERMRMYGINELYIVFSYIIHAGLKQLVSTFLFTILLKMEIGGPPLMPDTDFFTIFLSILLLNLHSTAYFLAVSSFFNSSILRSIVGTASYIYLFLWAVRQKFSTAAQIFGNMFAPLNLVITLMTACGFEQIGGVTFKSLVSSTPGANDLPLIFVIVLMLIGTTIEMLVFFYMLNVKPGPYGSAKPFYFIIPGRLLEKCIPLVTLQQFSETNKNDTNFREGLYEKVPENIGIGIKIRNLYKKYGTITSVRNLSLNIYSGQITALLGHNGAGKTTTLSILAGMLSPTSGSAIYKGFEIFSNLRRFRRDLGLCPQNDLLHPYLKVINQLIFFGMLSGLSKEEAEKSADELLKVVGIYEKKFTAVDQLSGGMKRKLCIALSLLGKPTVVILDEPTSGVDPESRREIWNVLLEARGERIMLITTHFMEEADALGDQIAIMNHGEIVCYGTPMFLKKHYGAGYHLTISCSPGKFDSVIETVTANIPSASIIGEHEEWVKFKLPFQEAEYFPNLFEALESDREISRIGISCTTMEDVYLKAEEEAGSEISTVPLTSYNTIDETSGRRSYMVFFNRFLGLVTKNMQHTWSRWLITIFVVFVVPCVASYFALDEFNTGYDAFQQNSSDFHEEINHPTVTTKQRRHYDPNIVNKNSTYHKTGTLASGGTEQNSDIFFQNYCIPNPFILSLKAEVFTLWITYVIFIISSTFSTFVHTERVSTVKHLMLMTGLSPITYWVSTILWDMFLYLVFALTSWITLIVIDSFEFFEKEGGIYLLLLILFLSGASMISSVYFITLLFKTTRGVIMFYYAGVFTLGFISSFVVPLKVTHPYSEILKLQPLTTTILAIGDFMKITEKKHDCKQMQYCGCDEIVKTSYLEDEGLRKDLLFLFIDFLFYMVLVILADYGLFAFIWDKVNSVFVGRIDNTGLTNVDGDVAREKSRVDAAHSTEDEEREPISIVDGLAKKYSRSLVAVYDVTFAVTKGECFGLLGVNGAGKSTTFNMLTGLLYPTEGNVYLKGHSLKKQKSKCLSFIGYCPQHSTLIESLTARQMLTLFARLRLVPSQDISKEVDKWITLFGLEEYRDRPCGTYSGGNKRKLNTALAFVGDPSVILLDEPTTGVDPFIRRNLWNVIHACRTTNQAIIISSHSMDECEAVCDRLTIMVRGRMECIGNTQHLMGLYGRGYVIKITLKSHTEGELAVLKNKMMSAFSSQCVLKDEHQVLLHYHLETNVYKLSQIFSFMEQIKKESSIVDDYIITDSSLEEVFLSFAKKQNQ